MNKLELLRTRRAEVLENGKKIREIIAELTDENSFAEFDSYSFSANEFYDGTVGGEGVVTGVATVNDNSVYIVAQNAEVLNGGVTEANCKKIVKCQEKALRAGSPVIYLLDSRGVSVGEGVGVLEGIAEVLSAVHDLKGEVPQIAVTVGDLFGSFALVAASCDYNFVVKNATISYASPKVIEASCGKNCADCGNACNAGAASVTTFKADSVLAVRDTVAKVLDCLPEYNGEVETMDDYNRTAPELNEKACGKCVIDAVFDKDYFIEMNADYAPEVITGIGRVGGISCAAIAFAGDENGVLLDEAIIAKIKDFVYYCDENSFPLVTFVNAAGIKADAKTACAPVMKAAANLAYALNNLDTPRINVVYKNAIGLGWTLFASKALGADFSYAFATSKISLFDTKKGAMIELAGVNEKNHAQAEAKYEEQTQDPFNAAKKGCVDDIIEPQFVRQYVISALQRLC